MKLLTALGLLLTLQTFAQPQPDAPAAPPGDDYRGSAPKINDLIHTRLDVRFDYKKCYLYGKEQLTLHPHFYPTDSLILDAKGMDIQKITTANGAPLHFQYDGLSISIQLDKVYRKEENYTVN